MPDRWTRAALVLALGALVLSMTGLADAARKAVAQKAGAVVRLDRKGKVPKRVLPTVSRARDAARLGGKPATEYVASCPPNSVDIGTWCMGSSTYDAEPAEVGATDYFFAARKCEEQGGWLPTAAQLIGSADRVKLSGRLDDNATTAAIDEEPADGLRDRREMSSSLVTTAAGSSAAGSQGVSDGSRGDPRTGEPDPQPQPADSAPTTLQYVTIYDNGNRGGFAGSVPVRTSGSFRCAFDKKQGARAAGLD